MISPKADPFPSRMLLLFSSSSCCIREIATSLNFEIPFEGYCIFVLSLLFQSFFHPNKDFWKVKKPSMKPCNIELDDLPVQERNCMTAANWILIGWIRFFVVLASSSCGYSGKFDLFLYVNVKIL